MYTAKQKGLFAAEGLDVSFLLLTAGSDVSQAIADGRAQFGTGNSAEIFVARQKGMDAISLGTTIRNETLGIMARPDSDLPTLAQWNAEAAPRSLLAATLKGKIVGITGIPANRAVLLDILQKNNVTYVVRCSTITGQAQEAGCTSNLDPDAANLMLVGGGSAAALAAPRTRTDGSRNPAAIDIIGDAPSWRIPAIYNGLVGADPYATDTFKRLEFADLGAPRSYILTIGASEAWTQANPALARGFMKAYAKGLKYANRNPEEAMNIFATMFPPAYPAQGVGETDDAYAARKAQILARYIRVSRAQWDAVSGGSFDADTDLHGLGWQDPQVYANQEQFLRNAGILQPQTCTSTTPVCVSKGWTNEFLPVE